jgi:hypothetical protein
MALQHRAVLPAFVAVCALLLAVGLIGPREQAPDHRATQAVAVGTTGATAEPIAGVAKRVTPPVLMATIEVAPARRGRQRLRPQGRRSGGCRRGCRPASPRMTVELPEPVGRFRH